MAKYHTTTLPVPRLTFKSPLELVLPMSIERFKEMLKYHDLTEVNHSSEPESRLINLDDTAEGKVEFSFMKKRFGQECWLVGKATQLGALQSQTQITAYSGIPERDWFLGLLGGTMATISVLASDRLSDLILIIPLILISLRIYLVYALKAAFSKYLSDFSIVHS
jgi:hypothetical protein